MTRAPRVLIDATNCKPHQGGVRTYTRSLAEALAKRDDISVVVATSMPADFDYRGLEVYPVSSLTRSFPVRAVWRELHLARVARQVGADVVLSPVPETPVRRLPIPSIVVIHAIGPL